jgi:hypothetical protein
MAGRDTAGSGRTRPGWRHVHGTFSLMTGSAMPASRGVRVTAGRTGAKQVRHAQSLRPPRGSPGPVPPAPQVAGPGRGESRAPPEQTFYQLNGRHRERVTRLPPARLRPAAMRQPAALLHLADMTILLLSAGSAAFSALPWQASMETHTQMAQFSARGSRWADIPHRCMCVKTGTFRRSRVGTPAVSTAGQRSRSLFGTGCG